MIMKKYLSILVLIGVSLSSLATDIAIWGNGGKLWSNELANESVKVTLWTTMPPTGEFKNYQVVMLANSWVKGFSLTPEDLENIRSYIKDGGIFYVEFGTAALLADEKRRFAQTQDIVGAQMYYYGAAEVSTLPEWENLLGMSGKVEFFKKYPMPYLGKVTTGKIMQTDGKNNAWLLVNRLGKGAFIFSSAGIFQMNEQPEIKKGIVNLLELIIKDGKVDRF